MLPAPVPVPASQPIPALEAPMSPTVVAEAPRRSGWIEANATEYEAPPAAAAEPSAVSGIIAADGLAPTTVEVTADVALAAPAGSLEPTGSIATGSLPAAEVALSTAQGSLDARGSVVEATAPTAQAALADPIGQLVAEGEAFAPSLAAQAVMAPMPGRLVMGGSAGGAPSLTATAEPSATAPPPILQPLRDIVGVAKTGTTEAAVATLVVKPVPPAPAKRPAAAPQPKPGPAASAPPQPKPIIKFDRHYPDVVVLPPPNTGAASSFATLQLR